MKFSIIVAFDNDFELINNFFENLLSTTDLSNGEVIFVSDGCRDIKTLNYIKSHSKNNSRIVLIETGQRRGYSISNNIGVSKSKGEYLVFINSDVLPLTDSIEKLISILETNEDIGIVQGLLIYPQNRTVQSTGHLFFEYQNCHVYSGESADSTIIKNSGERQALTTAFCAVRKDDFVKVGMFDEIYYNAFEGMEMSLKIAHLGKKCFYCADSIAYHIVGGSRSNIGFNNEIAAHIFWARWHDKITQDIHKYLVPQINTKITKQTYFWIQASSMVGWEEILNKLKIRVAGKIDVQDRFFHPIELYQNLPFAFLEYPAPLIFTVDKISFLQGNKKWIIDRNNANDLVIDSHGLLKYLSEII